MADDAKPGTALAPVPAKPVEAEKVAAPVAIPVPVALLLAAESVSARRDENRPGLCGVYLHARGDRGRVIGSDGLRMFIGSFALPEGGAPAWLKAGVILSNLQLKPRLSMLLKLSAEHEVLVSTTEGSAAVTLADSARQTVLTVSAVNATFVQYEKALTPQSFAALEEDGETSRRDWQPVGINSAYLKQCGEIAKLLEAGMERGRRTVNGMVVRAFNGGDPAAPIVFDFSTWPGAVLIVAPTQLASGATSKETAAILAPAVRATCAALTAHATRWQQRADAATTEGEKAAALRKAEEFRERVAAIRRTIPDGAAAIEGRKAKAEAKLAKPEPEPEPEKKPEAEAEAQPAGQAEPEPKPEGEQERAGEEQAEQGQQQAETGARPVVRRERIKSRRAA